MQIQKLVTPTARSQPQNFFINHLLLPIKFDWKNSSEKDEGFLAHEAQEVVPFAVVGEKDGEEMQQMDYGKLTPLLTATLQELITEVETLKAEVAALKGS